MQINFTLIDWLEKNILSLSAILISVISLWNNSFRVKNKFKVILIHEDLEDFFVLQNDGNKDQILLDYYWGYKTHRMEQYLFYLPPNDIEPITLKAGQKLILKPRRSLDIFIKSVTQPNYKDSAGFVEITFHNDNYDKNKPLFIGMAFKYLKPSGKVNTKCFNYAIYKGNTIILKHWLLNRSFIYLNR